jgi:hypothetical protein
MIRVVGFDNKEHLFNFTKNQKRRYQDNKSSFHNKARFLIKELFPKSSVYEEVTLPGSKKLGRSSLLYADFFIPELMLIIEVHGKQHYEFCSFFHSDKMDFLKSKKRDADKIEWCNLNNIKIVSLPYNKESEWKNLIQMTMNQ